MKDLEAENGRYPNRVCSGHLSARGRETKKRACPATSSSITYNDIEVNAGLSNRAMTNGIMWDMAVPGNLLIQSFLRDTRYSGDKLYSERTTEVGFSVGHKRATKFGNPIYVGTSYFNTDRDDLDGFKVNFGASL